MAGDWIKWMKGLSKRREVVVLARKLGISRREAACACMEMWEWADGETANGNIEGALPEDIDRLLDLPGFATALLSSEVAWLTVNSKGITFPRWTRNNGESAKRRANDAAKKRQQRDLCAGRKSRKKRDKCPEDVPKKPGPEERERERREEKNISDRTDRLRSAPHGHSDLDISSPRGEPFDLSGVDWGQVAYLAKRASIALTPRTDEDRRAILRYAVMAQTSFSEHWFIDSLGVLSSGQTMKSRLARFIGSLQAKAAESGIQDEAFNAMARRIEIPSEVWKSDILEVRA